MLRKPFLLLCLLLLGAADVSGAQAAARQDSARKVPISRSGTWGTRTPSGQTLYGTWTATPDSTGNIAIGTWTIADAQGKPVASGAWSAAKSPDGWSGAWRSVMEGRSGEFSGTWTSTVDLRVNGTFADLFEKGVNDIVSGNWRAGGQTGPWSIRTLGLTQKP